MRLDRDSIKVPSATIAKALNAEGISFNADYIPLNLYPIYQKRMGYGSQGCPFTCAYYGGTVDYTMKNLPVTDQMTRTTLSSEVIRPPVTFVDVDQIIMAFQKIFKQIEKFDVI